MENLGNAFDGSGAQLVDTADGVTAPSILSVISVSISLSEKRQGLHGNCDRRQNRSSEKILPQRFVREEPDDRQTQDQHRRKHRTPDTDFS